MEDPQQKQNAKRNVESWMWNLHGWSVGPLEKKFVQLMNAGESKARQATLWNLTYNGE